MRRAARGALLRTTAPRRRVDGEGTFALTFDDGPDEHFTPRVLDVLAARGTRATFFMVGRQAARHPELVRRVVAEGHAIASHTWSHPDVLPLPARELLAECRRGRAAVERAAGRRTPAYRPPKGDWNATGALVARAAGLRPWLWSLDPADWRGGATAEGILDGVRDLASGDVVLLHDGIAAPREEAARDRSATVAALPGLLDLARRRGLRAVGVDEP